MVEGRAFLHDWDAVVGDDGFAELVDGGFGGGTGGAADGLVEVDTMYR
jgi:hypothetical protein